MTHRSQLIDELQANYELLIHDDFDSAVDMSAADHLTFLHTQSDKQLADLLLDDEL